MIHVISGAPCSGKSTYVHENAKSGDVIVDYDEIARALGAGGHLPEGDIKQAAFRARKSAIDYCIETKCESWIVHSSPTDEQRKAYADAGAEFVELKADMETCLQRAIDDDRPPGTEQIIRDYFEAAKAVFLMPEKGVEMHRLKACIKSELKEDGGIVKGYASTLDREPDAYGDVVAPGAFAKSLERWKQLNEEGKYIPLLWGHDTDDPKSNIGRVVDAIEDERGLLVTAEFDAENEKAQYVRKLVREGRVYQFSFAYEVRDQATVELESGQKANELRDLELFEVSLVQIPANQHATVEEVKSSTEEVTEMTTETKAGRRNSAKDADELNRIGDLCGEIQSIINGLLAEQREEPDEAQGHESQSDAEAKSEEPDTANDEELKAKEQVDVLLQEANQLLKEV